ncbi:MAG TPA: response regulator [Opitutaceae bacterium]
MSPATDNPRLLMNLVKKILVVHGEAKARRRLVLTLADSGYDLRAFAAPEPALESARSEWFDLALIDGGANGTAGFSFAEALKKTQPTVPVVLLVPELELPLVIKGIRAGLADVVADAADPRVILKRVHSLLRPAVPDGVDDELTAGDLAEVEDLLARLAASEAPVRDDLSAVDLRQELVRAARDRAALELRLERLNHEKGALEAELRTLLAQTADGKRLQAELAELRTQRELAAATQAAIDAKASRLAATREEIARERAAVDEARRQLETTVPFPSPAERELKAKRDALEALRQDLHEEQDRLRDEAARNRQEAAQIAQERRRWHEDLDLLAAQEDNLRAYEERLRRVQAKLESDRVLWHQTKDVSARSPLADDTEVRLLWEKLQRATELLEADRAVFRDERMALREFETSLKRREEALRQLEAKQAELDKRLRALPPPPAPTLTRSPFSIWGKGKA